MYLEKPVPTDEVCEFEGKTYRWFRNEHCMVMCGFDKENGDGSDSGSAGRTGRTRCRNICKILRGTRKQMQ